MNTAIKKSMARLTAAAFIACAMSALPVTAAQAQQPAPSLGDVTVNVFPGGFNWPSYVAEDKGFFQQHGINVILQATTGSVAQMTDLSQGHFDIAMTAIDNIVAYVEGEGEAPIGPQPDFVAVMGSDSSFLSLVAAPDIKTYDELRGKTLSVDARTTGYAFVLYDMLARKGLKPGDYTVETAGGMTQRWTALQHHMQVATLLSTPFNILARNEGFNQIVAATDVIGPYQGNVAATRRSWARQNKPKLVAFIQAYVEAIDWLYDPKNHDEAIRILLKNVPQMSPELASTTYGELLDPKAGFFRKGRISVPGIKTVLALRTRYAMPHKALKDPMKYYDPTYYRAAMH
ncbi:ABC transporter substrate-binding protein [Paraburkholderia phytofirmans]|uniref:ABC transporter substrate-binding protein n=1 Tax=Paraburkholderia sp. BL9I2N2 TaxID=1938809 RepID=UPI001046EEA6|nr:ABC transporter substrate-binding protein [Paraburkholderia sp. BL9I2N2]TCK88703.1 ABC-type nitrate/sulfonate/bicarbonate transport system substrate-binding protein [Paraburkholderia sp. BL9I2N2]